MDIIIPYKATHDGFELRYAVRSIAHVPHDRLIVAGDDPGLPGAEHVPVEPMLDRYASSTANILAACRASTAAKVIVTHDDIFVLRPWTFRHEHRGTINEYLRGNRQSGSYRGWTRATRDMLQAQGVDDPLCYSLHTPTVYDRENLIALIEEYAGQHYLLRTLYHNLYPQPAVRRDDVKVRRWVSPPADLDVVSISDAIAAKPAFRRWIHSRFPKPSSYERAM